MTKQQLNRRLDSLFDQGFDRCYPSDSGGIRVKCSQCEALVVNGVPTHEHRCPNTLWPMEDSND